MRRIEISKLIRWSQKQIIKYKLEYLMSIWKSK